MKPESIQQEALMRWPIKMVIEDSPFGEIETDINISNREAFISGAEYASQFTASPVQEDGFIKVEVLRELWEELYLQQQLIVSSN